jgi:hypothetical protein
MQAQLLETYVTLLVLETCMMHHTLHVNVTSVAILIALLLCVAVCRNAIRGGKRLFVASTARFSMNAWVRLLLDNRNNGLVADLHSGLILPDPAFNNRNDAIVFSFKVTEVG